MRRDRRQIGSGGVVSPPFGRAQDRIEALGIEVAIIDLVTGAMQRFVDPAMQRGGEAVAERMGKDDQNAQVSGSR